MPSLCCISAAFLDGTRIGAGTSSAFLSSTSGPRAEVVDGVPLVPTTKAQRGECQKFADHLKRPGGITCEVTFHGHRQVNVDLDVAVADAHEAGLSQEAVRRWLPIRSPGRPTVRVSVTGCPTRIRTGARILRTPGSWNVPRDPRHWVSVPAMPSATFPAGGGYGGIPRRPAASSTGSRYEAPSGPSSSQCRRQSREDGPAHASVQECLWMAHLRRVDTPSSIVVSGLTGDVSAGTSRHRVWRRVIRLLSAISDELCGHAVTREVALLVDSVRIRVPTPGKRLIVHER